MRDARSVYFEWLYDLVCGDIYSDGPISYRKLLLKLHDIEFSFTIPRDVNRAEDGISLRYRCFDDDILDDPCSVLEMMVALAVRCEEDIMDDASKGDRRTQWFWQMIKNLGLGSMTDERFDERYVERVINRFLDREYEPDGRGGLFTIKHCDYDLRLIEIWVQMLWYLDSIT